MDPLKYAQQHQKQEAATKALQPVRVLFWGNRVGKTEWGGQETVRFITGEHPYRDTHLPIEAWIGCPSFDLQPDTTQKKLQAYLPADKIAHVDYIRGSIWKNVRLKDGSLLTMKSYEQGREKWQGAGKRLIWFDEEPPYDIWEEAFVRQEAGIPLDIIMTMTAIKGMTWVYDKLYLATNNPDIFISEAGWDDNPFLGEDQKTQMARGLSPEALLVRKYGKFVRRVGLVCAWFNRSTHIRHYDSLDKTWTWFRAGDGGYSDPFAYLLIGVDHQNSVHIVKGFREPNLLTEDIKSRISTIESGLIINDGFGDNDNPRLLEELHKTSETDKISIRFNPIEKVAGDTKSWDEFLAEKLDEYGRIQKGTGEPRLFISDALVRYDENSRTTVNWLQQEIENLTWLNVKSKDGEETKPKWDDHRRYKHHFDGIRALAYFLVSYQKPVQEPDEPEWASGGPSWSGQSYRR